MKNILLFAGLSIMILFAFYSKTEASEVTISGSAQFDSTLSDSYMEKHGYVFIEESFYKNYLKTNMYGLRNAEVLVKDEFGAVLGTAATDNSGRFSVNVPRSGLYKIIVRFKGHEVIKEVRFPKIENVIIYSGFYKSDIVASWIAEYHRAAAASEKAPGDAAEVGASFSRAYP